MVDLMEKFQHFSRNVIDTKIISLTESGLGINKSKVSITFKDGEVMIVDIPTDLSLIESGFPTGFANDREDMSIIYAVLIGGINKDDPVFALENDIFIEPK